MSIKNKLKTSLTRVLTLTLALSMCLSPLTALAVNDTAGNDGGGIGGMGTTTDDKGWSETYQGYRIYVLNSNLERISPMYDFVYSNPVGVGEVLAFTRFDTGASPDEHYIEPVSTLQTWCNSSKSAPTPTKKVNGVRQGNGLEFKEWFFAGKEGSTIFTNTGNNNGGGNAGTKDTDGDGIPDYKDTDVDGDGVPYTEDQDDYDPTVGRIEAVRKDLYCPECGRINPIAFSLTGKCRWCDTYTPSGEETCENCGIPGCDGTCETSSGGSISISEAKELSGIDFKQEISYPDEQTHQYIKDILISSKAYNWIFSDRVSIEMAYTGIINSLQQTLDVTTNIDMRKEVCDKITSLVTARNATVAALAKPNEGKVSVDNNLDILNQNIPLSGNDNMPAYNLVNKDNTIKISDSKYKTAAEVLADGGYLAVEPITWINLQNNTSRPRTYNIQKSYGTFYNLASKWVGTGINSFYNTPMTILFNNCMVTSKSIITSTGRTMLPVSDANSQKEISTSLSLMNGGYGLSLHLYDATDFNRPETSTYDEQNGHGPAPDDSDQLTEEEKNDDKKHGNIVKFYKESKNGEVTRLSYTRETTPRIITIESEDDYLIEDWYTSPTFTPADDTTGNGPDYYTYKGDMPNNLNGNQPRVIELGENDTTLYVLLVKSNVVASADYVLEESEISKPINTDMESIEVPVILSSLQDACSGHCNHIVTRGECNNNCVSVLNCSHSNSECGEDDCTHTSHGSGCYDIYCSHVRDNCTGIKGTDGCYVECTYTLDDTTLTFKFRNARLGSYTNIIASASSYTPASNFARDITRTTLDETLINVDGFNFSFVAYRGDDKLTYAKRATQASQRLFGFNNLDVKTSHTRVANGSDVKSLTVELVDDGSDLITTSTSFTELTNGTCNDEDTATAPESPFLSYAIKVLVKTYKGVAKQADSSINPNPRITIGSSGNVKSMGRMVATNTSIKFNPYIQMTTSGTKVAVLSEHRREILPNDYAEVIWTRNDGNLLIQSQMWATDASLTNNEKDWTGVNQVLKGGASLQLTNKDAQTISLKTYQVIVEGTSRNISEITGTYRLTQEQADTYHREFVDKAKETFDKASLVQYVSKKNDGEEAWKNGILVTNGSNITNLSNGSSQASTESKYYLQTDVNNTENAQRADLDVWEDPDSTRSTTKNKYRFYSDVEGNVFMEHKQIQSDGTERLISNGRILTKTQGVSNLTGTAANINNRTYAVTKLLAAIERNTGSDTTASWAPDGKWYNEAYEGITVYTQETKIYVGLKVKNGKNPLRTMVLDPKLIPKVTSKNDQGTTAFSTCFVTDLNADTPIAQFKGTDIFMMEPAMLFNSRNIYITNMTVDDNR